MYLASFFDVLVYRAPRGEGLSAFLSNSLRYWVAEQAKNTMHKDSVCSL